jgi:hypothetical protein
MAGHPRSERARSVVATLVKSPLVLLPLLAAFACTGPKVHVENPHAHAVFVDGVATTATTLPFRYYGVSRWDALPADVALAPGRRLEPDWEHRPTSRAIPLPPPAPGWLFPLDFPLEIVLRALRGREDTTATVHVEPAGEAVAPDLRNAEFAAVARRAKAARSAR